jgi:alpha-galactosidase
MKTSGLCLVVLLAAAGAARVQVQEARPSGPFNGRWVVRTDNGDGTFRETVFALEQRGSTVTGRVINPTNEQPIVGGAVDGDNATFAVITGRPPNERRTEYRATHQEISLEITVTRPGQNPQPLRALPGPPTAGDPPPRIEPPPLHRVADNGLARTPPMGWNSWNHFRGRVDDGTVRAIADAMVSSGMKAAGYTYVNIDDTWEAGRDASGRIQTNRKFPDMKALADYVHSKGLKLGIYSSPGPHTCAGYQGSYGHEEQDARTYAAWGIDYLKYDWCGAARIYKDGEMQAVYQKMGDALRTSGRDIVYSLCQYGRNDVWTWGPQVGGNLWRTTGDIGDSWESMTRIGFGQDALAPHAGPGHWNDPDMLEIGNGGMSGTEYRTHMSLWALLAAPLLAGNDLRSMSPETVAILTNREVIAVDQDALGRQGQRVRADGAVEIWDKPLADGGHAVGLFNRGAMRTRIAVRWSELRLHGAHTVRDLWAGRDLGRLDAEFATDVDAHGVALIRIAR